MAKGSANMEGDHNTHGAPMPHDEIFATKKKLGLDPNQFYYLPSEVIEDFQKSYAYAREEVAAWNSKLAEKCKNLDLKCRFKIQI